MRHCARSRESMARLALVSALFAGALAAAGCARKPAARPAARPEVAVVTMAPQSVVLTADLPGRVSSYRIAEVRPQVSGVLLKRLFTEGAEVRAGQALYQIDPSTYRASLDNARATLARAEAQLPAIRLRAERVRALLPDKAVSEQDVDDANAALKQAEAEVQGWRAAVAAGEINLGYCRIVAPIAGRIGRSGVTEGALLTAYQPLAMATIQQMDSVFVDVPQSTSEVLLLRQRLEAGLLSQDSAGHNKVSLLLEDATPYPHVGTLKFRDVTTDPTTGSVLLRIVFPNPEAVLLPGMFVRALVEEGVNEHALLIPQQGVARTPKGDPVALVVAAGDTVRQKLLTLDRAIGSNWLVATGLQAGDRVIVEGSMRVRPGMAVNAVPFDAGRADGAGPARKPSPGPAPAN
ncbi:MAG: efflux RND transporter periplasmic adaptor subunit [Candidatus Krumholzibacteriia bacterium]